MGNFEPYLLTNLLFAVGPGLNLCNYISNPDWSKLEKISADLSRKTADMRHKGSARSGDYSTAAAGLGEIGLGDAPSLLLNNYPLCLNSHEALTSLKIYILKHEARGRLLLAAHRYKEAAQHFNAALTMYSAMFYDGPPPTSGFTNKTELVIKNLKVAGSKKAGFKNNQSLLWGGSSLPQEYVSWAQVLISKAQSNIIEKLEDPEKTINYVDLEKILENEFNPVNAKLNEARNSRGEFLNFLHRAYGRNSQSYNFYIKRLDRDFYSAETRIKLGRATLYLKAANRMRLNNPESSIKCINNAKKIILEVLNGKLKDDPPEELINALLTLAWAYSSTANLKEEQLKGSGKADAEKAAIIYKFLLYGRGGEKGISDEEVNKLKGDWPKIEGLSGGLNFIRESRKNILEGRNFISWTGHIPDLPARDTISLDLLGFSGTNEIEILLNLADNLKTSRNYERALQIYNRVLDLEKSSRRQAWMKDMLFMRAKNGKAQILIEKADDVFGRVRAYDTAIELINGKEGTVKSAEEVLTNLVNIGKNPKSGGRLDKDIYLEFRLRGEMLKAGTTLAWAYGSLSRYLRETGRVEESIKAAKKAELINRALRGEALKLDGDDEFNAKLSLIRREFGVLADTSAAKKDLKIELNLVDANIDMGVADALALQRKFEKADKEYSRVIENFELHGKGSRYYYKARLGKAQVKIELAKIAYTQSGDINTARQLLKDASALNDFNNMASKKKPKASEELMARMSKAAVAGTKGWLTVQHLNRNEGQKHFDKAADYLRQILTDIENGKIKNAKEVLREAYLTKGQLYFILAETLKAKGERNLDALSEAEAKYDHALSAYNEEITKADTPLARLGILEARVARAELLAFKTKLLNWSGEYAAARGQITKGTIDELRNNITELKNRKAYKLAFRAASSLAWLYGIQGNIREKTEEEGKGEKLFLAAAGIYKAMLDDSIFSNEEFLILMDTSRANLIFTQAELIKAAGVRKIEHLQSSLPLYTQAKVEFEKLLKRSPTHPLSFVSKLNRLNADCGIAEAYISMGMLLEEDNKNDEAENSYKKAIEIATVPYNQIKGNKLEFLEQSKTGLRIIKALTWAYSSLGQLRESIDISEGDEVRPEYLTALRIYQSMFKEKDSTLLNDETLFATDTSPWAIRFGYIGILISAKLYKDVIDEYNKALADLNQIKSFGIKESEFLANIHAAVGDIYCFKLTSYSEAKKAYDLAMAAIAKIKDLQAPGYKVFLEIYLRLRNGYAKLYLENEETKKAIEEYGKIIDFPIFKDLLAGIKSKVSLKLLRILATALLGRADAYNYKEKDAAAALKDYYLAQKVIGGLASKMPFKRYLSQSYLGIGDVQRLRNLNYSEAIKNYNRGIGPLEKEKRLDRESKKVLAQLYASKAVAQAMLKDYKTALELIVKALSVINTVPESPYDPDRNKILDRIQKTIIDIRRRKAENMVSVEFKILYVSDSYLNDPAVTGIVPSFKIRIPISTNLKANLEYLTGTPREISGLRIDRPHTISAGLSYNYEGDSVNVRLAPSALVSAASYSLGSSAESTTFLSSYLAFRFGLDYYKKTFGENLLLMLGFDAEASLNLYSKDSPSTTAKKETIKKYSEAGKSEQERAKEADDAASYGIERLSLSFNPYLRLNRSGSIFNTSLTAGFGVEYNPQAITVNGFWPLDKEKGFARYYFSAGLDSALHFGSDKRWYMPIQLSAKYGNILYLQAGLGLGYLGDKMGLNLLLGISHFADDKYGSKNTTGFFGLTGSF